jgi:dTDP-4-dehydrorhamnose reductase
MIGKCCGNGFGNVQIEPVTVIVLGASGMLGHKLLQRLGNNYEIAGTVREQTVDDRLSQALPGIKLYPKVDATNLTSIEQAIDDWKAQVVLNCVGIVKQSSVASDPVTSISINSLFPHQLARMTAAMGIRLIHFSTDCVFSGRRGNYSEGDNPDPIDLYGRSKLLGEVVGPRALTLRTSIVGRELREHLGLIDWFLSQRGNRVDGYVGALYSGLTTLAMAELVSRLIREHPELQGVWHLSGNPISKFDLLKIVDRSYNLGIDITPDEKFQCDRRLDSARFRKYTGWQPASWEEMIANLYSEESTYGSVYSDFSR